MPSHQIIPKRFMCIDIDIDIDNLYFKSVIILHSKHELPGLLADYKITIQNITYMV